MRRVTHGGDAHVPATPGQVAVVVRWMQVRISLMKSMHSVLSEQSVGAGTTEERPQYVLVPGVVPGGTM
jgi:hypothetical protein